MADIGIKAAMNAYPVMRSLETVAGAKQLDSIIGSIPRPFVLMNERELSVLRRGLTKTGWKRDLYTAQSAAEHGIYVGEGLLDVAKKYVDAEITIPEPGGNFHHFFCECGEQLAPPPALVLCDEYQCPACEKTWSGEPYDGGARYILHNRLAGAALSLALVYGIEKEKHYSDKAAEILKKYAEAYPGPHTAKFKGGILQQSLCECVWVIALAQAYDLIYYSRSLSEEDRDKIESKLFGPLIDGIIDLGVTETWGSWHLSAIGVVGFAIKNAEYVQYALDAFRDHMEDQVGADGLWPESVHTYHYYALSGLVHFAEACYRAGLDAFNYETESGKGLKLMFKAPLDYIYPSFRLPAINDGWYDSFLPVEIYEIAYRRWDEPEFAWVLKRAYKQGDSVDYEDMERNSDKLARNSFYAFLFGRDLPGRVGKLYAKSHEFSTMGIACLRDGKDTMATLDFGHVYNNGHLDTHSFTFFSEGKLLVPDFGTPGYGSPVTEYYRSTPAHNTVTVDRKNQAPVDDHSLKMRYYGSFTQFAEASSSLIYPGVKHTRRLLMIGKNLLVGDHLESEEVHEYDWIMRCTGKQNVGKATPAGSPDIAGYDNFTANASYPCEKDFFTEYDCGVCKMSFATWNLDAQPETIITGTCPGQTADERVDCIIARKEAKKALFISAMAPSAPDEEVELDMDGSVICIKNGDIEEYIHLKGRGPESSKYPLKSNGEIAVVRVRGGEIIGIGLGRGSKVRWGQDMLLESPFNIDYIEISFEERNPQVFYSGEQTGVIMMKTSARAIKVNGLRALATGSNGYAMLRLTPQMLGSDMYQSHI